MNTLYLHDGMDDMAEFGVHRVTAIDLERRIAEKCAPFPVIEAASACTEIGAEPSDPRDVDLSHLFPLERCFRDFPATTWACVFLTLGLLAYASSFVG